jgi:hypothetical protein
MAAPPGSWRQPTPLRSRGSCLGMKRWPPTWSWTGPLRASRPRGGVVRGWIPRGYHEEEGDALRRGSLDQQALSRRGNDGHQRGKPCRPRGRPLDRRELGWRRGRTPHPAAGHAVHRRGRLDREGFHLCGHAPIWRRRRVRAGSKDDHKYRIPSRGRGRHPRRLLRGRRLAISDGGE